MRLLKMPALWCYFGIIAKEQKIRTTDLSTLLQLEESERIYRWVGKLEQQGLIEKSGTGKGTAYQVSAQLMHQAAANLKTTLKTVKPHDLQQIIVEE